MPAADPLAKWLRQSRRSWALLAQAGIWLIGVLGGFLLPPPFGMGDDSKTWLRFAQFLAAILLGLVFFGVFKWKQKKHARAWWIAAATALILATTVFFRYQHLSYVWTGEYDGRRVVIGSDYTAQAKAYVDRNPGIGLRTLLEDFIGRTEDIWTRESLERRRMVLAGTYVSCVPLFTVCILSAIQALQCLRAGKQR